MLKDTDGDIHSIWGAADNSVNPNEILLEEPDFPDVPDVFTPPAIDVSFFTDSSKIIMKAYELGKDINERCKEKDKPYYDFTPLD